MNILFYDIETSPIIAATWGIYEQNIPYQHVIQDWHIICAAWKWEGDDDVKSITCKGLDDSRVVKKLHGLFSAADVIVAHNGDRFDWKKFMARSVHHGMSPVKEPTMIDTLKMSRKFAFTSRKLDDLGIALGTGRKLDTERGLWVRAAQGDTKAIKALETYCKGDIPPLENLYHKLAPYVRTKLNRGLYTDRPCCPSCGSDKVQSRGYRVTKVSKMQSWQCQDCGSWTHTTPRVKGAFFK